MRLPRLPVVNIAGGRKLSVAPLSGGGLDSSALSSPVSHRVIIIRIMVIIVRIIVIIISDSKTKSNHSDVTSIDNLLPK